MAFPQHNLLKKVAFECLNTGTDPSSIVNRALGTIVFFLYGHMFSKDMYELFPAES